MIARYLIAFCIFGLAQMEGAFSATILFVPSASTVAPGGSFTVDIYGTSVNTIGGFSLFLNSNASGNQLQITSQSLNTTSFTYGGPSPSFPESISATAQSQDLGAFSTSSLAANTQFLLGTDTIFINASTPGGIFQIGNTSGTVFDDPTFSTEDFAGVSNFSVTVTPEPSTWALLFMGMASVGSFVLFKSRKLAPVRR